MSERPLRPPRNDAEVAVINIDLQQALNPSGELRVERFGSTAGERREVQQRDPQATGDGSLMPAPTAPSARPAGMT
jgi:hypothetical protein